MGENFGMIMRICVAAGLIVGLAALGQWVYNRSSTAIDDATQTEEVSGGGDTPPQFGE